MPYYYKMEQNLTNPDHYKALFTKSVLSSVSVIGVSGAITRPPAPVFVSLPSLPSTWESLQVIIPTVLTFGIVGYPFIMPSPVGGDFLVKESKPPPPVRSKYLLCCNFNNNRHNDDDNNHHIMIICNL